jgi:hypothetical protein
VSVVIAALTLLVAQITAADMERPRVPLCTAQEGELDRKLAVRRADGRVWWFPYAEPSAVPYNETREVTALQRPWFRERSTLTVDGSRWRFSRIDQVDNTAFRRYNRPHEAVEGVPGITPMGLDDELWILLEPIGCRFAVWTRAG